VTISDSDDEEESEEDDNGGNSDDDGGDGDGNDDNDDDDDGNVTNYAESDDSFVDIESYNEEKKKDAKKSSQRGINYSS